MKTYEVSVITNGKKEVFPFLNSAAAEEEFISIMRNFVSRGWEMERIANDQRNFKKGDEWAMLTIFVVYTAGAY